MNAMEKVSWAELVVSLAALMAAALLIPWLGNGAVGAFGLLGLLGFTVLFLRKKGQEVVIDERDHQIDERARRWGITAAWQTCTLGLIAVILWSAKYNNGVADATLLTWLLWGQIAICLLVKGLTGVWSYRRKGLAA